MRSPARQVEFDRLSSCVSTVMHDVSQGWMKYGRLVTSPSLSGAKWHALLFDSKLRAVSSHRRLVTSSVATARLKTAGLTGPDHF